MEEPLHIALVEDTDCEKLKIIDALHNSPYENHAEVFPTAEDFLAGYKPDTYDLVLMDIFLEGGMSGVEAVRLLRKTDPELPIAFVTTSLDFTLEGYRLNVLRYIEKPVKQQDIDDILRLALSLKKNRPALVYSRNGRDEKVELTQILYFEQHGHQTVIHRKTGDDIAFYEKLNDIMERLPQKQFYSPHKSFIVNLAYVTSFNKELRCFLLSDGENIPISRDKTAKARKALEEYLFKDMESPA